MEKEAVLAQERDPFTAFTNRVIEINYGNSYFFKACTITSFLNTTKGFKFAFPHVMMKLCLQPIRISNLRKVDPLKACEYFNSCFKDPSTFSVVIVGNIDTTVALPLILQYLVS